MTPYQLQKITSGLEKGFYTMAGDYITYVAPDGTQTPNLLCMISDVYNREGIEFIEAGIQNEGAREVSFLKSALATLGVRILPAGYFIDQPDGEIAVISGEPVTGERWDFEGKDNIQDKTNPIGGLHNMLVVRIRRSEELNQSRTGTDFAYNWEATP